MVQQRMRLWSLLLAFVLFAVAGIGNAGIARAEGDLGTVYVSVSLDDNYIVSDGVQSGMPMAYVPIPLDEVEDNYDLATWKDGLYSEYIKHDDSGDPVDAVTLLQVFLYVLDHYYSGKTNELNITGAPTSLYFQHGFFGFGENLNYYVNGKYPLMSDGWGSTADWIEMSDGDFVDVGMYTDWYFWTDANAGFHYFREADGSIEHEFKAEVDQPLTVGFGRAWGDLSIGGDTVLQDEPEYEFFYGKTAFDDATAESAVFDENSQANLVFDEPGEYYLWAYGGTSDDSGAVVNTPAYAKILVDGPAASPETVTETVTAEPVTETVTAEQETETVTADPVTQTSTATVTAAPVTQTVTAEPVTQTSTATVTAAPVTETVTAEAVTKTEIATSTVIGTITEEPVTLTTTARETVTVTAEAEIITSTVAQEPTTVTVTPEPVTKTTTLTSTAAPVTETVTATPETTSVTMTERPATVTVTPKPVTITAEPVTHTSTVNKTVEAEPVISTVTIEAEPLISTVTKTQEPETITATAEPETITTTVTESHSEGGQSDLNESAVVAEGSSLRQWWSIIAAVLGVFGLIGGLLSAFQDEISTVVDEFLNS